MAQAAHTSKMDASKEKSTTSTDEHLKLMLTGNPEADANIKRFYAARAALLESQSFPSTAVSSDQRAVT